MIIKQPGDEDWNGHSIQISQTGEATFLLVISDGNDNEKATVQLRYADLYVFMHAALHFADMAVEPVDDIYCGPA